MLAVEAFKGQPIKGTGGAYKGKRGFIFSMGVYQANVKLEDDDNEKPFINAVKAYEQLEPIDGNTTCEVKHCPSSPLLVVDAPLPITKHYDEHYASMVGLEPIELMQLVLSYDEFIGFLKGNIIKYTMRAGKKQGEAAEKDAAKAKRYIEWLMKLGYKMPINPKED
jgi:hypothetical protein